MIRCKAVIIIKEKRRSRPTKPVISTVCAINAMVSLFKTGLCDFMSYHVQVEGKYTEHLKKCYPAGFKFNTKVLTLDQLNV